MQVATEQTANGVSVVKFIGQIDGGDVNNFLSVFFERQGNVVIDVSGLIVPPISSGLLTGLVMEIIRTNPDANVRFFALQDDMHEWCSIGAFTHSANVFWDRQLAFDFS
jgi:hypothetical protein